MLSLKPFKMFDDHCHALESNWDFSLHVYCSCNTSWNCLKLKYIDCERAFLKNILKGIFTNANVADATSILVKLRRPLFQFESVLMLSRFILDDNALKFVSFIGKARKWYQTLYLSPEIFYSLWICLCSWLVLVQISVVNWFRRNFKKQISLTVWEAYMIVRFGLFVCIIILCTPLVVLISVAVVRFRRQKNECKIDEIVSNSTACRHLYRVRIKYPPGSFPPNSPYANKTVSFHCNIIVTEEVEEDEECVPKYELGDIKNCSVTKPPCKNVRFEDRWTFQLSKSDIVLSILLYPFVAAFFIIMFFAKAIVGYFIQHLRCDCEVHCCR